jgi:hypothetical protein
MLSGRPEGRAVDGIDDRQGDETGMRFMDTHVGYAAQRLSSAGRRRNRGILALSLVELAVAGDRCEVRELPCEVRERTTTGIPTVRAVQAARPAAVWDRSSRVRGASCTQPTLAAFQQHRCDLKAIGVT